MGDPARTQDQETVMDREDHSPPSFGTLLKKHRQDANLTQKGLAERARVSEHSISNLEREVSHAPRQDLVLLLAQALQLPLEEATRFSAAAQALRHPRTLRATRASTVPLPLTPLIG